MLSNRQHTGQWHRSCITQLRNTGLRDSWFSSPDSGWKRSPLSAHFISNPFRSFLVSSSLFISLRRMIILDSHSEGLQDNAIQRDRKAQIMNRCWRRNQERRKQKNFTTRQGKNRLSKNRRGFLLLVCICTCISQSQRITGMHKFSSYACLASNLLSAYQLGVSSKVVWCISLQNISVQCRLIYMQLKLLQNIRNLVHRIKHISNIFH